MKEWRLYCCRSCKENCILIRGVDSKSQLLPYKCPFNMDMNGEVFVRFEEELNGT